VCLSGWARSTARPRPDDGQFDKTRWSMVLGIVQSRAPCAQKALAELCGLYSRPLYAFARRRGNSLEDAQDLVQGFFEHLIGSRGLKPARPRAGCSRRLTHSAWNLLGCRILPYRRSSRRLTNLDEFARSVPAEEFSQLNRARFILVNHSKRSQASIRHLLRERYLVGITLSGLLACGWPFSVTV
jgi:DNA-directed RNA polymerase specialized sigma24 family protein